MKHIKENLEIYLLVAILAFGLFLRLYGLSHTPLWVDEAISFETSKNILETGKPVFDSGLLDNRAYVFHYIQAFFMLFGQTELIVRLVSVLFGLLTIFLAYRIGKEYSRSGGLISALFVSIFYLEVFFSRHSRMYQMFQLFFFLSIYLLYKSKEDIRYLYFALVSLVICYDTQIAGIVLTPFFILHILYYHRKQAYLALIPLFLLILKFIPASSLSTGSLDVVSNYGLSYLGFASNIVYLLIFSTIGAALSYRKNKLLTLYILVPSIIALIGVFSLQTIALRYAYFFVFPILLYSGVLFGRLYEKYGKIMIPILVVLILLPSNLIFPYTYSNVIKPVDYQLNDITAPYTDYTLVPGSLIDELRENVTLISLFSLDVKHYVRTPDYVIPFSMNGLGDDQISYNSTNGVVDRYSGAQIINYSNIPKIPYNVIEDLFSSSKLTNEQREQFDLLLANCSLSYSNVDLKIWSCK